MLSTQYSKLVKKSGGREIRVGKLRYYQDEVSLKGGARRGTGSRHQGHRRGGGGLAPLPSWPPPPSPPDSTHCPMVFLPSSGHEVSI